MTTQLETVERGRTLADAPVWLAVRLVTLEHTRRADDLEGPPCECCGSTRAVISSRELVDTLLLHVPTGERYYASAVTSEAQRRAWRRAEGLAAPVDLWIRCSDYHDPENDLSIRDVLFDRDTIVWAISGGNRSTKTTHGCYWLAIRWFYARSGALLRAIGPEMKHAHIIKKKLVEGEVTHAANPPVFPPALVLSYPDRERETDQNIHLIDGTRIQLMHAKSAGAFKGVSVLATLWTEVAECNDQTGYTIALGRTADTFGQLYLESTPKIPHWLKTAVVDEASRQLTELRKHGEVPTVRAMSMSSLENPWISRERMLQTRAIAAAENPQLARREFDGEWVGDSALLFGDLWDGARHVVDVPISAQSVAGLGLQDITVQVSRRFFKGAGVNWVAGVDVNRNPHTAVICRVFGSPGDPSTWGLYIHDEVRTWDSDARGAAKHFVNAHGGQYRGAGICIDANAAHSNQHAAHTGGRATTPVKDYRAAGFNCRPNRSDRESKPQNPSVRDSTAVIRHLMRDNRFLVNSSCAGVIRAIESVQNQGDGRPVKQSNTYSDREISAYIDSLRYLAWALFGRAMFRGIKNPVT